MARIGVEQSLTQVKEALMEMGHEIIDLRTEEDARQCDCCVVSGMDNNVMGMQDTVSEGQVINAQGYSAEEITQMVNERLS
ncbi:YkuS family protein [Oceanobacillus luteolus]|uniref:YkuS family protein n=1 Tax=Oceanobacillus luteolus TaxID=1274358 RepID=UPI00203CC9C2|nr:YkuS family protein [Oceanobacillus luteolus]MCM3741567.1 YkuS family protein [Oceanobacillus luteolus]